MSTDPPSSSLSPAGPKKRRPWLSVLLLGVGALAIAGVVAVLIVNRGLGPRGCLLSPERCVELEQQKNAALAKLENSPGAPREVVSASEAFAQLDTALPNETLGRHNLAIARLIELEGNSGTADDLPHGGVADVAKNAPAVPNAPANPVASAKVPEVAPEVTKEKAYEQALAALEKLPHEGPGAATTELLAAKVEKSVGHNEEAIEHLRRAAMLAPQDASLWYELYEAYGVQSDKEARAARLDALKRAVKVDPTNVFLIACILPAEAEAHDPEIVETIGLARPTVRWIAPGISSLHHVDANKMLDEASAAVQTQDWQTALKLTSQLGNVIKPDASAQADLRRVAKNVLEYVKVDFSPEFQAQLRRALSAPAPVPLVLRPFAHSLPDAAPHDVRDVAIADFDLDGHSDVLVLTAGALELFTRAEDGTWRSAAKLPVAGDYQHLAVADLDGDVIPPSVGAAPGQADQKQISGGTYDPKKDADPDVVLWGPAGIATVRNKSADGSVGFELVPQTEGLEKVRDVTALALVDIDQDGDLDIAASAGNQLTVWGNRENFSWFDMSDRSSVPEQVLRRLQGVDFNRNSAQDLIAVTESGQLAWLENLYHGRVRFRTLEGEAARLSQVRDVELLDSDANQSWDLATAGGDGVRVLQTSTPINGAVQSLRATLVSPTAYEHVLATDLDNDGFVDLVVYSAGSLAIFRGQPGGQFVAAPAEYLPTAPTGKIVRVVAADLDGDGDMDLAIVTGAGVQLLENQGGNKNHWLDIRLRAEGVREAQKGQKTGRINQYGIGSTVELRVGPKYQAQVAQGQLVRFGLGQATEADLLRVTWTNGVPQDTVNPKADQTIYELQQLLGSCPYLYVWTGERYEFFTDLLWNAPLGLQLAEGVFAEPKNWEYLLIPGDRLKPQGGRYKMQFSEELWEAGYFDRVQLLAVDHPADVSVFSNEKVGPPDISQFKIHTAHNLRSPVAARDAQGADVLKRVQATDGVFARPFARVLRRGLTSPNVLELDLGKLDHPKQVKLFLTGWIYPSSTSTRVGFSQNPNLPQLYPPALWVPNQEGKWTKVRDNIGFPGGKTKTIVVDVTDAFLTSDYRVRVDTNMEICWDSALFTVDEPDAPTEVTRIDPVAADLHYRGFSLRTPDAEFGPDHYHYDRVCRQPIWPAMGGRFTRYGDVLPLLTESDDQMAIIGAGDEMSVEFPVPTKELKPGWKRDFLLYNVGWDKDADLNTAYGQTVEPLPFGAMHGYPYLATESYPDTPEHRRYLEQYQTRAQPMGRLNAKFVAPEYLQQP